MTVAIGPGPELVAVELYAPAPTSSRWDQASWDGGSWGAPSWQVVGCDVVEAQFVRGVTDEAGVLSQSAAGPMDLATLDPNRELDPSNAAGPYFGSIAPGTPIRLRGGQAGSMLGVWTGFIDEATHDVAIQRGRVRCVDAIAQLAQAKVPDGTVLPNTLRARVRAIVAAAGLGAVVPVQPDIASAEYVVNGSFEDVGAAAAELVVNGSFAQGMASWPRYSGPVGSAGSGDPTVGTFGRWQGDGSSTDVQAVQTVPVVEGLTYTVSAMLAGTGVAAHPGVLQADARNAGGGAVAFNVVSFAQVGTGWQAFSATYAVPVGQGITNLTIRVGIGTDGSNATSAHIAYASGIHATQTYPKPAGWSFVPDAVGWSSAAPVGQAVVDGVRALSQAVSDAVATRAAWQLVSGLIAGQTYTLAAWGGRSAGSGSSQAWVSDAATGGLLATLTFANAAPMAQQSTTFVAPASGQVYLYCGQQAAAPPSGTAWLWDVVSINGPTGDALPPDPPVAPFDGKSVPAWTAIQNAALDALVLVWLDPGGTLRFTSWGGLPDAVVSIGCPPAGESAAAWVGGLSTVVYGMSAAAIRNRVRAYTSGTVWTPYVDDAPGIAKYGARPLDVDRVVPDFANWSARILADRADAGLSVTLGEIRPYSLAELVALLNIGTTGPQVVRVADDEHGTPIDDSVGIVGTQGRMTAAGWSFRYVTMIPRADWDAVQPPPVTPPIPPPNPYHQETRTYVATSDALLALTSGGSKYGAGASSSLPVGVWSGWTYRACIQLPVIDWTKVRRIVSATLQLQTTTQVRVGFGSSPTIEVQRITGSWSAGSSSSPSGGNAVVYPGPASTPAGAVRANLPTGQGAAVGIRIDAIATAWTPGSIGGTAAPQRGVVLLPGSGSSIDTTEVWPTEKGGAARPSLLLVVEVFD